jgi:hypothetical protein
MTAKPSPTLFLASRVFLVVPSWGHVRIGDNPTAILSMGAMGKPTIDMRSLYFGNCEL